MDYIPEGFHNRSKRALGGMINNSKTYSFKISSKSVATGEYKVSETKGIIVKKVVITNTGGGKWQVGSFFSFPNVSPNGLSAESKRKLNVDCFYNLGSREARLEIIDPKTRETYNVGDDNQVITYGGGKLTLQSEVNYKYFTQPTLPFWSGGLGCIFYSQFPYKWKSNGDLEFASVGYHPDLDKKRTRTEVVDNINWHINKDSVFSIIYDELTDDNLRGGEFKPHILCGTKGGDMIPSRLYTGNGYFPVKGFRANDEVVLEAGIYQSSGMYSTVGEKDRRPASTSPLGKGKCGSTEIEVFYQKAGS